MKIEITDKHGVRIDGKTFLCGQSIDKEADNTTKQSLIDAGVAVENSKPEKANV